jgi:hypothetical protein
VFRWNGGAARYIAPTGRFVSRSAVRATLDVVLDVQADRVRALSEGLVAGTTTLATWRTAMVQAIKVAHLEGAAVARGGWHAMTQEDYEWTGERIHAQLTWLQQFHDNLASGFVPLDGSIASRAEMYVAAGRGTQREMERRMAQARGVQSEKNVLGPADHCAGCLDATAQGWVPIGTLPPIGDRTCLSNCHCWLIFKTKPTP